VHSRSSVEHSVENTEKWCVQYLQVHFLVRCQVEMPSQSGLMPSGGVGSGALLWESRRTKFDNVTSTPFVHSTMVRYQGEMLVALIGLQWVPDEDEDSKKQRANICDSGPNVSATYKVQHKKVARQCMVTGKVRDPHQKYK
jgi:hypothetical protein